MPLNDPIGSSAADVLVRNASDLDKLINSSEYSVQNRVGDYDRTISGINQDANDQIARLGFEQPISYNTSGQTLLRVTQTVTNGGLIYAPAFGAAFPFVTSGAFDATLWRVINTIDSKTIVNTLQVLDINGLRSFSAISSNQRVSTLYHTSASAGGGGVFYFDSSSSLADDGWRVIKPTAISGQGRFILIIETELYVSQSGAIGDGAIDDTQALKKLFDYTSSNGIKAISRSNAIYKTTSSLNTIPTTDVNVDFNGSTIRPEITMVAGSVLDVISFRKASYDSGALCTVKNVTIDGSLIQYFSSTTSANRKGCTPIAIRNFGMVEESNIIANNFFYGYGISVSKYNTLNLSNINMTEVGSKFNPTTDDTSSYDAAGDGVYLGDVVGDGITNITNLTSTCSVAKLGRGGIVLEDLSSSTTSHFVTLNNVKISGYHRIIHEEDGGKSSVVWNGGEMSKFSCGLFALSDTKGFELNKVKIDVNPPFTYGGNSGITNLYTVPVTSNATFNNCEIVQHTTTQDKGARIFNGGRYTITAKVNSSQPHSYNNVHIAFNSSGGFNFVAGEGEVVVSGGSAISIGNPSSLFDIKTAGYKLSVSGVNWSNAYFNAVNTTQTNKVTDSTLKFSNVSSGADIFSGSSNCGISFYSSEISALDGTVSLYGDGGVDVALLNNSLKNVMLSYINGGGDTEGRDINPVKSNNFIYTDLYSSSSIFGVTFNPFVVFTSNTFVDKTTSQKISTPSDFSRVKIQGVGNVMVKNASSTVI